MVTKTGAGGGSPKRVRKTKNVGGVMRRKCRGGVTETGAGGSLKRVGRQKNVGGGG